MGITKELSEIIDLAKASALETIKGNVFFEKDTDNFFNGLNCVLNGINETVDVEKMKDLIQLNFQAIYMLMKASKREEVNLLVFALEEKTFVMKNFHSLTAIKNIIESKS